MILADQENKTRAESLPGSSSNPQGWFEVSPAPKFRPHVGTQRRGHPGPTDPVVEPMPTGCAKG